MSQKTVDTFNKFGVAVFKDKITIKNYVRDMTAEDALLLAAYLVSLAECVTRVKFIDVLHAVENT